MRIITIIIVWMMWMNFPNKITILLTKLKIIIMVYPRNLVSKTSLYCQMEQVILSYSRRIKINSNNNNSSSI